MISKIPRHVINYIEGELLSYRSYKSSLELFEKNREDLINKGRQAQIVPVRAGVSDPTGEIAARLAMIDDEIHYLLWRIHRIDFALETLTKDERDIVEYRYFSVVRYNQNEIMDQLHLCRNAYYGEGERVGALESMFRKFQRVFWI